MRVGCLIPFSLFQNPPFTSNCSSSARSTLGTSRSSVSPWFPLFSQLTPEILFGRVSAPHSLLRTARRHLPEALHQPQPDSLHAQPAESAANQSVGSEQPGESGSGERGGGKHHLRDSLHVPPDGLCGVSVALRGGFNRRYIIFVQDFAYSNYPRVFSRQYFFTIICNCLLSMMLSENASVRLRSWREM